MWKIEKYKPEKVLLTCLFYTKKWETESGKMTEWERLQKGLIYNDFDEDLFKRRVAAKKLFSLQ